MANGPRFAVKFRRRRDGSTNYQKRLSLLKSGKARLVIRRSNKHVICQIVQYTRTGDKVLAAANSKSLEKLGWKHSGKNLPAAYLTGYTAGIAAKKAKVSGAILDHGLYDKTRSSRIYATLKGVIDAGITIPHGEGLFPSEDRISGAHINEKVKKDFNAVKAKVK